MLLAVVININIYATYNLDRLINNSKIWVIIVLPPTIMIVMFGYLVFQVNSISVTLNAVLEQNSTFYETKSTENLELPQVEEDSNNNGTNSNSISEQLLVNNISSTTSSQSQGSGIDSSDSGQNMSSGTSPFKIITYALVPEPSSILSVIIRTAIVAILVFYYSEMAWRKRNWAVISIWITNRSGIGISNWGSYDL